jgi:MerR family mercuric resistance operon transcriptional regulator
MRPITDSRGNDVTIGGLSALTSVNIETIRYYEKIRMLPAPRRTASGRRLYGTSEIRVLAFVRRGRALGFTLDEIRALLDLAEPGKAPCAEVRDIASRHLQAIRAKIADLTKLERLLDTTVAQCSGRRAPECPVLDILEARRAHSNEAS